MDQTGEETVKEVAAGLRVLASRRFWKAFGAYWHPTAVLDRAAGNLLRLNQMGQGMTLKEARAAQGERVAYRPYPTSDDVETGTIQQVNGFHVLVKYDGDEFAKATRPEDLTLLPKIRKWSA